MGMFPSPGSKNTYASGYGRKAWQFTSMISGMSFVPEFFTSRIKNIISLHCFRKVNILMYQDDFLVMASSQDKCKTLKQYFCTSRYEIFWWTYTVWVAWPLMEHTPASCQLAHRQNSLSFTSGSLHCSWMSFSRQFDRLQEKLNFTT